MINNINIEDIKDIAFKAGEKIMEIYNRDFTIEIKEDKSPLTEADIQSNEIICNRLKTIYPHIPILSEENNQIPYKIRKEWDCYWCIDPIDGTKEFIKKNDEFTVNIALIKNKVPILGVVYAPAINEMYWAKQGFGAYKDGIKLPFSTNQNAMENLRVVSSKSHLSDETLEYIEKLPVKEVSNISRGSSLKLCMVASGAADIYPRLAPTMEWDTAAADAIVRESQGMTYKYGCNESLKYNKENLLNPWFIVINDKIKDMLEYNLK